MSKPKFDLKKTYISVIKNSVGAKMFANIFVIDKGKNVDVCDSGRLSCAVFVSYVLKIFDLIKTPHAMVDSTIKDMEKSGWYKISKPKIGAVLVWEAGDLSNNHGHIGFYYKDNKAVSNSSRYGFPKIHHWTYGLVKGRPKRRIISMYWHDSLNV